MTEDLHNEYPKIPEVSFLSPPLTSISSQNRPGGDGLLPRNQTPWLGVAEGQAVLGVPGHFGKRSHYVSTKIKDFGKKI